MHYRGRDSPLFAPSTDRHVTAVVPPRSYANAIFCLMPNAFTAPNYRGRRLHNFDGRLVINFNVIVGRRKQLFLLCVLSKADEKWPHYFEDTKASIVLRLCSFKLTRATLRMRGRAIIVLQPRDNTKCYRLRRGGREAPVLRRSAQIVP